MLPYRKPGGLLAPGGDKFRVVASGRVTPTGTVGSEYAYFNMTTFGAAVGDFMLIFSPYDGGVGSGSGAIGGGASGWTIDNVVWMYDRGNFAYKTLASGDLALTAMTFLTRSAQAASYVILRSLVGQSLTGTLKQKLAIPTDATSLLTFSGYTRNADSKGHVMIVADRDTTSIWAPPFGYNLYNVANDGTFACAIGDLRNPSNYQNLSNIVWTIGGTQLYGQTGILFELT